MRDEQGPTPPWLPRLAAAARRVRRARLRLARLQAFGATLPPRAAPRAGHTGLSDTDMRRRTPRPGV